MRGVRLAAVMDEAPRRRDRYLAVTCALCPRRNSGPRASRYTWVDVRLERQGDSSLATKGSGGALNGTNVQGLSPMGLHDFPAIAERGMCQLLCGSLLVCYATDHLVH